MGSRCAGQAALSLRADQCEQLCHVPKLRPEASQLESADVEGAGADWGENEPWRGQLSPSEVEGIIAARPMHIERFLKVLRPKIEKEVKAGSGVADNDIVISDLPASLARYNATYAPTGALVVGYPAFAAGPNKHLFRHPELERWILQYHSHSPYLQSDFDSDFDSDYDL